MVMRTLQKYFLMGSVHISYRLVQKYWNKHVACITGYFGRVQSSSSPRAVLSYFVVLQLTLCSHVVKEILKNLLQ